MKVITTPKHTGIAVLLSLFLMFILTPAIGGLYNETFAGAGTQRFFKNVFLVNITFMGDAVFACSLALALIFFFNNKKEGLLLFCAIAICLLITQGIKNVFYANGPWQIFFEKNTYLFDEDADVLTPVISSHTAIAIMLACFFSGYAKSNLFKIFLFGLAVAVAVTRVYTAAESVWVLVAGILPAVLSVLFTRRFVAPGIKKRKLLLKPARAGKKLKQYPSPGFIIFPEA